MNYTLILQNIVSGFDVKAVKFLNAGIEVFRFVLHSGLSALFLSFCK